MIFDEFGQEVSHETPDLHEVRKSYLDNKTNGFNEFSWSVHPSSLGRLSFRLLRYLYETSSAIRPAVDSISREVSTLPWKVINKDYKYHSPKEMAQISYFLNHPNLDGEKFQSVIAKYLQDQLVIGKGVIEKVRNPLGELKELIARDSTLYTPVVNPYGFIVNYAEYTRDTMTIARTHPKKNLIFEYFTPTTYTFGATPIIETIINEVALLMLSIKSIAWAFTRDEIPPGILHLGEIGEVALNRAKSSFEAAKGISNNNKLRVVDNVDTVNWVQFTRPFREMQVAELMPMIERIVFRNFGLSPVESSQVDITRNVAETSFKSSQSKLIYPMMDMMAQVINNEIVEEFDPKALFVYSRTPQETFNENVKSLSDLVDRGILSTNEARLKLGYDPVPAGDIRSYRLGNEVAPIDEKTGEPMYRNIALPTNNPPKDIAPKKE